MSGALQTPAADGTVPPTPTDTLDEALATLRSNAQAWCETGAVARLELLEELADSILDVAPEWVATAAADKGVRRRSPLMAEEWGNGPTTTLRMVALLRDTLADIARTGRPQPPSVRTDADGRTLVDVLPASRADRLLHSGYRAEVRLQAGVTPEDAERRMGRIYRDDHTKQPGVALVLGAGNVSSIGPMDALYQLFALDRVVMLKLNPANERIGPHLAAALQPLVDRGFLRLAYGGSEVGRYLTDHEQVDAIHVTGSDRTHDAIVFGTGPEGADRKRRGQPRIDTPVSSELGNLTPVIVVPGPWKDGDVAFHGDNIASMLINNAGFNCISPRMIVQHRAWARRADLLHAVRDSLRRAEEREPFYPGARERWERFTQRYRQAEWFGRDDDGRVPFTLIPDIEVAEPDALAFNEEAFCGLTGEVGLDAPRSTAGFLDAAVDFCNEQLWGTLSASILIHPRTLKDPEVAAALDRALDRLRYGTVVLNHWPGLAYALVSTPWGAYPGSELSDIQSGRGMVHNTFLLEDVEKTVVRGPFRPPLRPLWFHTHRTAHQVIPDLARFNATRELRLLPKLMATALRG